MTIRLGNMIFNKLYLGSTLIHRTYKGDTKIFEYLPGAVSNLGTSSVTRTTITWMWGAPVSGGTPVRYEYRRATGNAAFSGSWVSTGTTRSVTITGLTANTRYRIQVRVVNEAGTSAAIVDDATTSANVITRDIDYVWRRGNTSPSVPTGGTNVEEHTPTGWSRTELQPTTAQGVYRVQRTRTYTNGTFTSAGAWGTLTKTADRTLARPGPVRTLDETSKNRTRIIWGWGTPSTGGAVERYEVRTATGNGSFGQWTSVGTSRSYTHSGLSADTSYTIQVRAFNQAGYGDVESDSARTNGNTITTNNDFVWMRGTSLPGAPSGGTSSETHTPTGWSRTELSATGGQNVYRAKRVRTYTNGSFTSATAWGSVTKTADKTGTEFTISAARGAYSINFNERGWGWNNVASSRKLPSSMANRDDTYLSRLYFTSTAVIFSFRTIWPGTTAVRNGTLSSDMLQNGSIVVTTDSGSITIDLSSVTRTSSYIYRVTDNSVWAALDPDTDDSEAATITFRDYT